MYRSYYMNVEILQDHDTEPESREELLEALNEEVDAFDRWRLSNGLGSIIRMERQTLLEFLTFLRERSPG